MASPSDAGAPVGPPSRSPEEILVALAAMPDDLGRTLANRPLEDLMRPARDGGWGVIENLCHLRDWDEIFLDRLRQTVERDNPLLVAHDDDLWPIERDYRGQDPRKVFERFRAGRGDMIEFLEQQPADVWPRPAEHAIYGSVSMHWLVDYIGNHDREHLDQVRDALA